MISADLAKLVRFGSGAIVSFGSTLAITYVAAEWLALDEKLAFAVSLVCVFFINFAYLRFFVFQSKSPWLQQLGNFFGASIGFRVAEYVGYLLLLDLLQLQYLLAVVVVLTISFLAKFFVFNNKVFT